MVIKRILQAEIEKEMFHGKVIVVYGARQVGKTTLLKAIERNHPQPVLFLNCDEPDVRTSLTNPTSADLRALFADYKLILIDEAQRIPNVGLTLKLAVEAMPTRQIIATGSSSFELSNRIVEPLTGRKIEFFLHALSLEELAQNTSALEAQRLLSQRLILGMYPEVTQKSSRDAEQLLYEIAQSYLYRDVLEYHHVKKPEVLEKLLQALALQIGSEVSYTELARTLGVSKITVDQYVRLLEQSFIIFHIRPYQKNLRTELRKLRKIYFYDTGIRNAVLRNLNPLHLRQDTGALWENFVISERWKYHAHHRRMVNMFFWRTHGQQEIDLLEEYDGQLSGYELKWEQQDYRVPKVFRDAYPNVRVSLVHRGNMVEWISTQDKTPTI